MSEHMLWLLYDTHKARKQGASAIMQRQRTRFTEMVTFARTHSPYYRERYRNLPEKGEDLERLPIARKQELMDHFDDWVTDRNVTIKQVSAFINNPHLIGERYLDKYLLATTSGTTGNRGIFLMDDRAIAVNLSLTLPMMSRWLGVSDVMKLLANGGRMAIIVATGGHFLVAAGATRIRKTNRLLRSTIQFFSVHLPLPELVAQLNQFRPAIVIGYGSVMEMLADEQALGRLHIQPVLLEPAGETLGASEYNRLAGLFNAKVHDVYGATECPFLSSSKCAHGWYHVNDDWVLIEPVDAHYQPTSPGEWSHTVLVSNLANRVQPILRYDLGDSILVNPDPCSCGSPLPAIRVRGRAADLLTFSTEHGKQVTIAPLAFGTLMDQTPGIELFQIVQTTPTNLRVRLKTASGADPNQIWQTVHNEMTHLLASYRLDHVTLECGEEAPEQSPGGKYRRILPLENRC